MIFKPFSEEEDLRRSKQAIDEYWEEAYQKALNGEMDLVKISHIMAQHNNLTYQILNKGYRHLL